MILKNNFIKFLIIGTISTIINYLVFYIFYKLGVYYIVSSSFGYISGLVLGYFLNKNYNFYLRNYKHTFYKYILVYSINLGFSQIILYCLVNELNISVYLGNFLIIIYTTFSNYIGLKYYVFRNKPLLTISICGNSGTGKSTLAKFFSEIIGENNLSILVGDSSHKWGRNNPNRGKITHLNPKGNNLKKEENDIKKIVNGSPIKRRKYDHGIGEHTDIISINSNTFILYEGLHGLYGNLGKFFDIKIFLESDFAIDNKINRDIDERNRDLDKLLLSIEKRKNDYYKYILPQKNQANIIIKYENNSKTSLIKIEIKDGINKKLKSLIKDIPGLIIKNNKITINKNSEYNINVKILKKHGLNFIFNFNPNIFIHKSHKGILFIILIGIIEQYANNYTNVLSLKKV